MNNSNWSMVVAVLAAMLAAAQMSGPASLGLPPQAGGWMGILSAGLTAWALYLPSVRHRPGDTQERRTDPAVVDAHIDAVVDALTPPPAPPGAPHG